MSRTPSMMPRGVEPSESNNRMGALIVPPAFLFLCSYNVESPRCRNMQATAQYSIKKGDCQGC
ncbi:MAG: hypothetical protein WC483_04995 [Candidatus Paceibacterota bacterium]